MKNVNNPVFLCVDADNLRRRCTWFHQSAEKQVQVQTLLQEAPTAGVPASPDRVRGGRPRQVRTTRSQSDLVLYLALFTFRISSWHIPGHNLALSMFFVFFFVCLIFLKRIKKDFMSFWENNLWDDFDHIKFMMIWHSLSFFWKGYI